MHHAIPFRRLALAGICALATAAHAATPAVLITEWQYNGSEFVEFTNLGPTAVDFTGWSFDDSSRTAGSFSLSGFGIVASGESVIMSEAAAADFRATWNLAGSVKVVGDNSNNLGRSDEINLYDNTGQLVDRLTYGDQVFAGTVRTDVNSARANAFSVLGTNAITGWKFSAVGDVDNSYLSAGGNIGSPGLSAYALAPVPEPETYALLLAGLGLMATMARKRHR